MLPAGGCIEIDKTYVLSYIINMKYYDWSEEKNRLLKKERGVCFEDSLVILNEGRQLDVLEHPNKKKYPNQRIFVVQLSGYVYYVPFVEDEEKIFLKTIIPSRDATKKYLK